MDRDTAQALLDLLNPLHGALDDQISDEVVREELEIPKDYEHHVVITPQMERDLTRAVLILEKLKMTEKVKSWWSGDGQWFCMLVNDGVNQATVSLTPEEAVILSKAADESATPAGWRGVAHVGADHERVRQGEAASDLQRSASHAGPDRPGSFGYSP